MCFHNLVQLKCRLQFHRGSLRVLLYFYVFSLMFSKNLGPAPNVQEFCTNQMLNSLIHIPNFFSLLAMEYGGGTLVASSVNYMHKWCFMYKHDSCQNFMTEPNTHGSNHSLESCGNYCNYPVDLTISTTVSSHLKRVTTKLDNIRCLQQHLQCSPWRGQNRSVYRSKLSFRK